MPQIGRPQCLKPFTHCLIRSPMELTPLCSKAAQEGKGVMSGVYRMVESCAPSSSGRTCVGSPRRLRQGCERVQPPGVRLRPELEVVHASLEGLVLSLQLHHSDGLRFDGLLHRIVVSLPTLCQCTCQNSTHKAVRSLILRLVGVHCNIQQILYLECGRHARRDSSGGRTLHSDSYPLEAPGLELCAG